MMDYYIMGNLLVVKKRIEKEFYYNGKIKYENDF